MSPVSHFLISWMIANSASLSQRDRAAVTLAGVAPDLDGLGIVPELLTRHSSHPLTWFSDYHHVLGHNLGFAMLVTGIALVVCDSRWKAAALVFVSFHVHLLCDVLGARGPDGEQWAIPYLLPFSHHWNWTWQGQWALNAWPNFAITGAALVFAFWWAWLKGVSPIEMVSKRADQLFVATLRTRFPLVSQRG